MARMDAIMLNITDLSVWAYLGLRNEYWSNTIHTLENFLLGNVDLLNAKKTFKRSMKWAFDHAAQEAWIDGGGTLPMSQEAKDYLVEQKLEQRQYIDEMFKKIAVHKSSDISVVFKLAMEKADLWARSVDILYNNIKIINAGNIMLLFTGEDGDPPESPCPECEKYKGKWHTAKWWRSRNAVPPNRNFTCGGWNCRHFLIDSEGRIFTL